MTGFGALNSLPFASSFTWRVTSKHPFTTSSISVRVIATYIQIPHWHTEVGRITISSSEWKQHQNLWLTGFALQACLKPIGFLITPELPTKSSATMYNSREELASSMIADPSTAFSRDSDPSRGLSGPARITKYCPQLWLHTALQCSLSSAVMPALAKCCNIVCLLQNYDASTNFTVPISLPMAACNICMEKSELLRLEPVITGALTYQRCA